LLHRCNEIELQFAPPCLVAAAATSGKGRRLVLGKDYLWSCLMNRMLAVLIAVAAVAGVGHAQQGQGGPSSLPPQTKTPRSSAEPEIIIKEKIRAAGVSRVHGLVRNPDGSWQGKGTKDRNEIAVMVDTDGNVRFQ
jgi:hypothetical protein